MCDLVQKLKFLNYLNFRAKINNRICKCDLAQNFNWNSLGDFQKWEIFLTEMTTISISVVVLASLIFLDSLDSPLITLTFLLELSNLARFFSASLIARKSRKFKITKEMQGIQWTNRMRNLKSIKKKFHFLTAISYFRRTHIAVLDSFLVLFS